MLKEKNSEFIKKTNDTKEPENCQEYLAWFKVAVEKEENINPDFYNHTLKCDECANFTFNYYIDNIKKQEDMERISCDEYLTKLDEMPLYEFAESDYPYHGKECKSCEKATKMKFVEKFKAMNAPRFDNMEDDKVLKLIEIMSEMYKKGEL